MPNVEQRRWNKPQKDSCVHVHVRVHSGVYLTKGALGKSILGSKTSKDKAWLFRVKDIPSFRINATELMLGTLT